MTVYHGEPYPGFFKNPSSEVKLPADTPSWEVNWMKDPSTKIPEPKEGDSYYDFVSEITMRYDGNNWLACQDTDWLTTDPSSQQSFNFSPSADNMISTTAMTTCSQDYITLPTTASGFAASSASTFVSSITFTGLENKMILSIKTDGTVELGEAAKSVEDAASQVFWMTLENYSQHNDLSSLKKQVDLLEFEVSAYKFLNTSIRYKLGIGDEDSILDAIDTLKETAQTEKEAVAAVDPMTAYERAMKVV